MITHGIANVALVVTSALFVMSLVSGVALFEFYCVVALFLAGYLMGAARGR